MVQPLRRASALAIVAFSFIVAAPAQAATVLAGSDGGVFVGGDPTINALFITSPGPTTIRVRAAIGTATPSGPGCTQFAADTVECTVTALIAEVAAGAENDIVDVDGAITARLYGGTGDDVLRGGSLNDFLSGEEGNDQQFGRSGDDDLRGEDGNDVLDGEQGSDLAIGGLGADTFDDTGTSGVDSVSYKVDSVLSGVRLTVGDGGNDGRDGGAEADNVRDGFERLQGSNFNDVIRGGPAAETINGSLGDDDIDGGAGADTIEGNGGNDIIRARDGVADTRLDCDAASDPPDTNGTADAIFIDGAGLDPAPSRCEAVDSGTGGGTTPDVKPTNTFPPEIRGRFTAGERLVCDPGTWSGNPTFSYVWSLITADDKRATVSQTIDYTSPLTAAGAEVECTASAVNPSGAAALVTPRVKLAATLVASAYKRVIFRMPNFVTPTGTCGRKKGHCEAQEAYTRLNPKKTAPRNIRWKATEVEGLRGVPARLRKTIVPGAIFEQTPKKSTKVVTTADKPAKITVRYYTPNPERNCPITENVNEKSYAADYTLADLVIGMSLRNALIALRENGCTQQDFDIDYRYAPVETGPFVSAAREIDAGGRDQLRLTVRHSAPGLQLGIQPIKPVKNRLPMALAQRSNEIHFVVSKTQTTDFLVSVATRAGVGFKNARVELRNPAGDMIDYAATNGEGVATFRKSAIKKDGTYELWASVSDVEGDALVGWKPIKAIAVQAPFLGFTGRTYDYAKKTYTLRGANRGARARAAQAVVGGDTLVNTIAMAKRACTDVYPLLQPLNSAATSRTPGALTSIENSSLRNVTEDVCQFSLGELTLEQMIGRGTTPTVATLGGSLTLAIGPAVVATQSVLTFRKNQALVVAEGALRVGKGALGFVSDKGVTIYPGGSFSLQSGGGSGFGPEGAKGRVILDAKALSFAIERLGAATLVGSSPLGTGNLISDLGSSLIGQDGAGLLGQDGAGVVAGGAGNILSDNGLGLIGQDGAGLIGQDGAGIVPDNGGGLISDKGAGIVAGGAGNLVSGGAGN